MQASLQVNKVRAFPQPTNQTPKKQNTTLCYVLTQHAVCWHRYYTSAACNISALARILTCICLNITLSDSAL
jgi:hypothetical protein